ncbi:MAG: LysM peptidoglycan-binding domain-containing protein [Firmicutes bacterium]|nr:LysM peptidoglycan-binding domain-containing protein [Bacillota bacterium]
MDKRWKGSFTFVMICAATAITPVSFAAAATVTVAPGNTFYTIARREHISLAQLTAANPNINPLNLQVGQVLDLPSSQPTTYTVQPGDTEWIIARRLGISWSALIAANPDVNADDLIPGQTLRLPAPATAPHSANTAPVTQTQAGDTLYWLTKVIAAEAGGQPLSAKLAVGAVILNRSRLPGYGGNTILDVIFATVDGRAQFSSVANGWIYNVVPSSSDAEAARAVLSGTDSLPSALVFYNPANTPSDSWVYSQPVVKMIGSLVFAS